MSATETHARRSNAHHAAQAERAATRRQVPRRSRVFAWLLLVVLLAGSVAIWLVKRSGLEERTQSRFDAAAQEIASPGIDDAFAPYARLVDDMAERAASGEFDRETFLEYIDGTSLGVTLPATYAALITERVTDEELAGVEDRISTFEHGLGEFGSPILTVPDPGSGSHEIIVHAAPDSTRFNAIGFDADILIGDPAFLEEISGGATMLGGVDFSLIESLPGGPVDAPPEERWLGVIATTYSATDGEGGGISIVLVDLDELLAPVAEEQPGVGLQVEGRIIDVPGLSDGGLRTLAVEPDVPADDIVEEGFTDVVEIDALGAEWTLTFRELGGFGTNNTSEQWIWLGAGIVISLLLFGLVYSQLRARDRAYGMVDEATAELRLSEERFRQAFENEKELAERLQEADELKAEFVSMASHELRTPLTAATAFVDTVLLQWDRLDDDERKELLGRASGNAKELTRLIDQLLASVRLDDVAMAVEPEPMNLSSLVAGVVEPIAPLLAEHELDIDIDDDVAVVAGSEAFSHVLGNLLTNAAKYSEPGTRIRVSARRDANDGRGDAAGMVAIAVSDEGDGIPREDLDRVFERFFQSTASTRSSRAGLGVGLAVVRRYVEALGGEISVVSTVGTGSTFTFTLPDAAASSGPPGSLGAQDAPART